MGNEKKAKAKALDSNTCMESKALALDTLLDIF